MPVARCTWVALAVVMLAPLMVQAQKRVLINHASQLAEAPMLAAPRKNYNALAGTYVFYEQCGKELNLPSEDNAYVLNKFNDAARAYQVGYEDAYVTYVHSSPQQALVDDIAASIKTEQQKTVNGMALSIRNRGCKDGRFRKIIDFVAALKANDAAPPADPTLREPAPKFRKNTKSK